MVGRILGYVLPYFCQGNRRNRIGNYLGTVADRPQRLTPCRSPCENPHS